MSGSMSDKVAKHIMIAMIAGLILGLILHNTGASYLIDYIAPIGEMLIKFLKMVIVPLVFSSIYISMVNLGDPKKLGAMGGKAFAYYFSTTALAVFIGLIVVNLINPGIGVEISSVGSLPEGLSEKLGEQKGLMTTIMNVIMDAIPTSPVAAMAKPNILQVIVFSLIFGSTALFYQKEAKGFTEFARSLEFLTFKVTDVIMFFAPIGIFVLMAKVVAESGFDAIKAVGLYMVTVVVGLLIHGFVLLLIGSWRSQKSPIFVLKALSSPILTAFSTASSAASLPVTMATVTEKMNVDEKTAKFVLPLGATVNMDGTALYESVAVIFIGQAWGIEMTMSTQIIIFMTASLAAVGAAAIPGAGLITMTIVLNAVGFPIEGIGLILAVDRILDMFRTAVNVFGDCVGSIVVDSLTVDT